MSDLAERLRRYRPRDDWGVGEHHTICDEAAGEIERLALELAEFRAASTDKARAWDALNATFERGRRKGLGEAAEICTGWLDNFADTPIKSVPANVFASDAVRDVRAASAQKPRASHELQPIEQITHQGPETASVHLVLLPDPDGISVRPGKLHL